MIGNLEQQRLELAKNELAKYNGEAELVIDSALPSFQITAEKGCVTIAAPDSLELLYGVYEYAERFLGWCFFEPGRDRFNPEDAADSLPNGILVKAKIPPMKYRGFIQEFPFNAETPDLFDWMVKNKLNYIETWMKFYDDLKPELKEKAVLLGIEIESGHHNFDYWIPGKVYGKTHPEFFAEIGGKRISPSGGKSALLLSEQLCTTNPALREEMAKNMIRYCDEHPEIKTIAIVPNDGFGWCECPECSKFYDKTKKGDFYSLSEHVYLAGRIYHDLVNSVSELFHKIHPEVAVTFYGYINYSRPEPGAEIKKGTRLHFANYWRCINHTIDNPDCYVNSCLARDIREWNRVNHGGEIMIYEYFMGVNFYLSLPMVHFHEMFHEIEWYRKNGVSGINTQFHVPHWTVYGMNYYMMAKATRGDDEKESISRMFHALFGKDKEEAEAFYQAIKQLLLNLPGRCHIPYPYALFNRTDIGQFEKLHAMSTDLAQKAPEDVFRAELTLWTDYLIRFKRLFDTYHQGKLTIPDVHDFVSWIHEHDASRVFVQSKFDMYFKALTDALDRGTKWYHFNLEWEDGYICRHEAMWKKQSVEEANSKI